MLPTMPHLEEIVVLHHHHILLLHGNRDIRKNKVPLLGIEEIRKVTCRIEAIHKRMRRIWTMPTIDSNNNNNNHQADQSIMIYETSPIYEIPL